MKAVLLALILISPALAFHFYLAGHTPRCFVDDIPRETFVHGKFTALDYSDNFQAWVENPDVGIQITVDEKANSHRIINQRLEHKGVFSFTSAESGAHTLCIGANVTDGWFTRRRMKVYFDVAVGDSGMDLTENKEHKMTALYWRVHDIVNQVHYIRQSQDLQRERELEFRDLSEHTNVRAVYWTLVQMLLVGVASMWQLHNLKAFFRAKKLV